MVGSVGGGGGVVGVEVGGATPTFAPADIRRRSSAVRLTVSDAGLVGF
jgi:hypothetical protein